MYQIIIQTRVGGDVIEDFKGINSYLIAKKIGLLFSSTDNIVTVNRCDDETGEIRRTMNIWKEW